MRRVRERRSARLMAITGLAVASLAGLVACGADRVNESGNGPVKVVAGFYPLQYVAERVGGDRVTVTNLAQPGAEPHDLELSPRQVASISDADLMLYLRGFQPAIDEAVAQE